MDGNSSDDDSNIDDYQPLDEHTKNQIANFIREKRSQSLLTDKEISSLIDERWGTISLFDCRDIDKILYPSINTGGFWRTSYGFPGNGEYVELPEHVFGIPQEQRAEGAQTTNYGIARDVGFYMFNIDVD